MPSRLAAGWIPRYRRSSQDFTWAGVSPTPAAGWSKHRKRHAFPSFATSRRAVPDSHCTAFAQAKCSGSSGGADVEPISWQPWQSWVVRRRLWRAGFSAPGVSRTSSAGLRPAGSQGRLCSSALLWLFEEQRRQRVHNVKRYPSRSAAAWGRDSGDRSSDLAVCGGERPAGSS